MHPHIVSKGTGHGFNSSKIFLRVGATVSTFKEKLKVQGEERGDNERRMDKEDNFEVTDFYIKHLKENNKFSKYEINGLLYCYL